MNSDKPDYSGMTGNERLYAAGLLPEWDAAVKSRNRERMMQLLGEVGLSEDEAALAADAVLANPKRYGF